MSNKVVLRQYKVINVLMICQKLKYARPAPFYSQLRGPNSLWAEIAGTRCTDLKMACDSKTACHRVKGSEIWDPGGSYICIWSTFNLAL